MFDTFHIQQLDTIIREKNKKLLWYSISGIIYGNYSNSKRGNYVWSYEKIRCYDLHQRLGTSGEIFSGVHNCISRAVTCRIILQQQVGRTVPKLNINRFSVHKIGMFTCDSSYRERVQNIAIMSGQKTLIFCHPTCNNSANKLHILYLGDNPG